MAPMISNQFEHWLFRQEQVDVVLQMATDVYWYIYNRQTYDNTLIIKVEASDAVGSSYRIVILIVKLSR